MLRDTLVDDDGADVFPELCYGTAVWTGGLLHCEFSVNGKITPVQSLDVIRLFAFPEEVCKEAPKINGLLDYLPAVELNSPRAFRVMHVVGIAATNYSLSELGPWAEGEVIDPWCSQIAKSFYRPAIDHEKVPVDLDIFRLVDWPGHTHTVVTERGRDALLNWGAVASEFIFEPL